ncbi:YjaG family protein [Alteromonas gilva]|uniref:YjaG family protein n=1 Tax=Alteromonas gilva TaxID=2987522 RepID=A0ABT5KYU9_9ALTE|nr:YjaG family protein [Alteromonas gilva]MDC8829949.1 YjaG family protein [Alteromonas gilva]
MTKKLSTFAQVRALQGTDAIAFSAALLQRMEPNYRLFCELSEFADADTLGNCLALIWESLVSPKSKINFAIQLEKVEEATPDVADFDSYGVYPALDAAIAMSSAINLILKVDPHGAVVVSKLSQGSVEAYLLATGEATDDDVKDHPLMQFEIAIQQELLAVLDGKGPITQKVATLKSVASSEGISNIGLELNPSQ